MVSQMSINWSIVEIVLMFLGVLSVILILLNEFFEEKSKAEEE